MIVCLEGVAMPPKGIRRVRDIKTFGYCREERQEEFGDDSVQTANHAHNIMRAVTGRAIERGEPPRTKDHQPLFVIEIQVLNVHRDRAQYRVAWHKFDGCPRGAIDFMFELHAAVKRVVRRVDKETKLEREMRKREKAEKRIGVTA